MKIVILKESFPGEKRIAAIPATVKKLVQLGSEVLIESGLGDALGFSDASYKDVGAVISERDELFKIADVILRVRQPQLVEVSRMKKGQIYISFYDAFQEKEMTDAFTKQGITSISMEMMPRTTIAQKMDALSSQANLGGYVSVIMAAEKLDKVFPMMTTPAGTISPVTVFVIGVGVAGLQAIATAKRLGARVEAFDTRPVVEEQVKSLGARFVKVDLGEMGQTKDGYAKQLTDAQLEMQRNEMAKVCARSDIVITTAQLVGRKAPLIVTDEMIKDMHPGAVIVDMAVESGGNVEGSKLNETVTQHGVNIIGLGNLPGRVAIHASQMYASNLYHLINHFWDKEEKKFTLTLEDELLKSCIITHNNKIQNERVCELTLG